MDDLLNAVIEVISITPSDYGVKIEAQDKKVYNVPKTLKAGGLTKAWEDLINMSIKGSDPINGEKGSTVAIGYVEVKNKHDGISRYIRNFRETNDLPTSNPEVRQGAEKPDSGANLKPQGNTDEFWDKKAYKQCLWNYWLSLEPKPDNLTVRDTSLVWAIFNQIEKDADERFSKPKGWNELGLKLKEQVAPDIQETADEMAAEAGIGEDIPF